MVFAGDGEARFGHGFAEVLGVGFDAVAVFGGAFEDVEYLEGGGSDGGHDAVGEEVGAGALAEDFDDFLRA